MKILTFSIFLSLFGPTYAKQSRLESFIVQFYQLKLSKRITTSKIKKMDNGFVVEGKCPEKKLILDLIPKLEKSEKLSRFEFKSIRSDYKNGSFRLYFILPNN